MLSRVVESLKWSRFQKVWKSLKSLPTFFRRLPESLRSLPEFYRSLLVLASLEESYKDLE